MALTNRDDRLPATARAALAARGVVKRFGPRVVLRGVDVSAAPGERLALLGPNGVGKTTLLKILATLGRPSAGAVEVAGVDALADPAAARRQLGLVSHQTLLHDELTAEENLRYYGRLYGVPELPRRIDELLEVVGLAGRRRDRVRTFSRGMQQRLAIARALLHEPQVLLMDEPDTGLDQGALRMLEALLGESAGRRAVVVTTHSLERALAWTDRVAILARGRIAVEEPTASLGLKALQDLYRAAEAG